MAIGVPHGSQYNKAPITEAVVEFRLGSAASEAAVEKARKAIGKSYARSEEMKEVKVHFEGAAPPDVQSAFAGVRFFSDDGTDVVWVRPTGLSISRLAPYRGWDEFRSRAVATWTKWRKALGGGHPIGRIGLRYINRIDIPAPHEGKIRIEDYLGLTPRFPDDNQVFHTYTIQAQLPLEEGFKIAVNTGTVPPALINHMSVLLDLDVVKDEAVPQKEEELWAAMDAMRKLKNQVFESYITDKTRALFS